MNNEVIEARLKKLRGKMVQKGLDVVLVTKRENYIYLSGFTGTSANLIITKNEAVLVTDFRYVEQASFQAPLYEIVQYQGSMVEALSNLLKRAGVDNLGFEETHMSYAMYNDYKTKLGVGELVPLEGMIENLRIIKDQYELDIIIKAVEIADGAFKHVLGYIKPGVTESEVAAEIEYFMKKNGARGASFDTIVGSGERGALPHGVASEKKLELGDAIVLDYGAIYNEYCSDMTRTVFLGNPADEMKKIYNIVLSAQLKASEGARKGLIGKEIDAIARDHIYGQGYEGKFGHGLGHGVGLQIHEEPRLSPLGNVRMENGMVVTVEPGIYLSGLGGVRIEDIIVINDDKPMVLTRSPKEMIII